MPEKSPASPVGGLARTRAADFQFATVVVIPYKSSVETTLASPPWLLCGRCTVPETPGNKKVQSENAEKRICADSKDMRAEVWLQRYLAAFL